MFGGGGADGDGEEFVAAVEGEDVVGGQAVDFGGGFAEGLAGGGGVFAELLGGDGADGVEDIGAGGVGVFVGVEFDDGGVSGLFAGDVAGGGEDVGAEDGH